MEHRAVHLADEALAQLIAIPSETQYQRVVKTLELLEIMPQAFPIYDPAYEAARPPVECRVAYAGHYGIYYDGADTPNAIIRVFAIEDQRRDPMGRFA